MRAKKSYGQHFLHNTALAERIANFPNFDYCPRVLEVGPGRGALTRPLLSHPIELKVVEADRDMIDHLKVADLGLNENQIIADDVLHLDMSQVFHGQPFVLIGNYPYNISSQILIQLVENRDYIPEMVGMFQREVAERVVAGKGSKTYGTLSVLIQVYYDFRIAFRVSKGNFSPPPKVESAVLHGRRRGTPLFSGDFSSLQAVVRSIFGQRRKMIRNSLKALMPADEFATWPYLDKRPEELSLEQFVKLAEMYEQTHN
ncbi:MAG: ribosomal RNA small subunit methyltransferase A [Bacteroidetes bacterium]|jgi:16S rRNA (adenine1518-N6/adenine1519-N6)-dimethyltransferase|nr:ribosomal RNA small subunit methyltransferase A [Bacteroidota bacterium]